jgi:hypothetical protein
MWVSGIVAWPLSAEEPRQPTVNEASEIAKLVENLGAGAFVVRERATNRLLQIGPGVLPAVRKLTDDPDREVSDRARRIVEQVNRQDRPRRLAVFLAGSDDDQESPLPGWESLRDIAGDNPASRRLLAETLQTEWDFLERLRNHTFESALLITHRSTELQRISSRYRQPIPTSQVVALLLCALERDVALPDQTALHVFSVLNQPQLSGPQYWHDPAFRQLVGAFITRTTGSSSLYQGLHFALRHELPEGLVAAERALDDETCLPHVRQLAILTVARFGDQRHVEKLQTLLNDSHVFTSRAAAAQEAQRLECQVRDLALAALVHLVGKDPREFGFKHLQLHAQWVFDPTTVGFLSQEERMAAIRKWRSDSES